MLGRMRRVIGYARLSEAREASTSISRQREIIAQTAAARGWDLVDIIEDHDASASKLRLNRPGLTEVRRAIKEGRAEAVLVWRLDRLAHSVTDFGLLLDEGIGVVSCTEPLDTTSSMGRAMAEILQVFAAMEARTISARVSFLRQLPPARRPMARRSRLVWLQIRPSPVRNRPRVGGGPGARSHGPGGHLTPPCG